MLRTPPRSTRTDTLFPYTTPFRSRATAIAALTAQLAEQAARHPARLAPMPPVEAAELFIEKRATFAAVPGLVRPLNATPWPTLARSEEHTSELQSLMRISYAVFCLKQKI